ncbi:MAG: cobaltochelatase subunit CobT, partial [Rhodospirillales bacterium]
MNRADSPSEAFKRITAATLRAMAGKPDIEVSFSTGQPGLNGAQARLPQPSSRLEGTEVARLRGASDALALRLRYHDAAVHAKRAPVAEDARRV